MEDKNKPDDISDIRGLSLDKIYRVCSICNCVEREGKIMSKEESNIEKLAESGFKPSHGILSKNCFKKKYGQEMIDRIPDAYNKLA